MGKLRCETVAPAHNTLYEWAASHIRELIVTGQLEPGQTVPERDLAACLSISRTPIREALRELEREHLVTIRPNRETVVAPLTPSHVAELYQMRAALEGMAARLTAQVPEHETVAAELADTAKRLVQAIERQDSEETSELSLGFHDSILRASRNALLLDAAFGLRSLIRRCLHFQVQMSDESLPAGDLEHIRIAEAIRLGDADLAEALARQHALNHGESLARGLAIRGGLGDV
jgi:DNA-binding GntR family transcriptional regulator